MKMRKALGAGVMSLGLVLGLGGFAGATSGSIGYTGPDSWNEILGLFENRVHVNNHNKADVYNHNDQFAKSGDAEVKFNTSGGGARSGDAVNTNSTHVSATIDNSAASVAAMNSGIGLGGGGSASINTTGPFSHNKVLHKQSNKVYVNNHNKVNITNTNDQFAKSGDAEVKFNTTGGSAVSGDARNSNSTTVNLRLEN